MWRRIAQDRLVSLSSQFPAVLIFGARQVGKTTLARATFPSLLYCDLEEPGTRAIFEEDPVFLIEDHARA